MRSFTGLTAVRSFTGVTAARYLQVALNPRCKRMRNLGRLATMIKDLLLDDSSDRVVINLKDNSILVDLDDNNGQTDETLSGIARVLLYEREIEGLEFFLEAPHPNTLPQSSVQEAIIGALRYLALKGLTKGSIGASQFHTMNALSAPTTTCVAKISLDSAHPKTAFITIKVSERR